MVVKCVVPGDVHSPNHNVGRGLFAPDADDMGRMIMEAVEKAGSEVVIIPFWGHWVQWVACVVQPFWVLQKSLIYNIQKAMKERDARLAK